MTHFAQRTSAFDSSGIRKVFDLAAQLTNPINLSIGQPDFDVPEPVKEACIEAIRAGKNGYTVTQGLAPLRERLQARIDQQYGHPDRKVVITSGTSGGLTLLLLALIDPGDEVLIFDPYFVMYPALTRLVGGVPVIVDTYPDFRIDLNRVADAITPRTRMILLNSPANPTGVVAGEEEVQALAELAQRHGILLVSDEIYSAFCFDGPLVSPARYYPQTIVIDGFSKSHGMTGWRLGYVHGPAEIIQVLVKLQQYTFVCAPQPAQWAGIAALNTDVQEHVAAYRRKRDRLCEALADCYELVRPGGAFYLFPKSPRGTGSDFVAKAIEQQLLIIPGNVFSRRDTHFRIAYAASDEQIERGIEVLRRLAKG
jgi:aspartate aminotransferase/aminotransferase